MSAAVIGIVMMLAAAVSAAVPVWQGLVVGMVWPAEAIVSTHELYVPVTAKMVIKATMKRLVMFREELPSCIH